AGGRAADRSPRPGRFLALLEIGLGVYCLASLALFSLARRLYLALFPGDLAPLAAASLKFAVVLAFLLPPTMAIGAVFPTAVRLVSRSGGKLGGDVSLVYGLDTLGAAAGALLAGFLFVPLLGLLASTLILGPAAVLLGIFLLRRREEPPPAAAPPVLRAEAVPPAPMKSGRKHGKVKAEKAGARPPVAPIAPLDLSPRQVSLVLATFFSTGLAALLLETGWNRFFYVLNGTSVYSLAVVLAGFLSGIGIGSVLMRRRIDRLANPLTAVAYLYAAIALSGVLVFRSATLFQRLYLAGVQTSDTYYGFQLEIYLSLFVIVLAAALGMGANFPLVTRIAGAAAAGAEGRGRSVGRVFFVNTLGAVLGAFLGEFVLLPRWGFSGLLSITVAIYALAAAVFLALSRRADAAGKRNGRHLAACAALLLAAFVLSPPILPLALPVHAVYYHGLRNKSWSAFASVAEDMKVLHRAQGFYGEVAVVEFEGFLLLKQNGKTDASTGPDDNYAQLLLGHVPLFLHPHPRRVLNIGLGGGATLRAIVHHREVERITQVELDPLVVEAARTYFAPFNDHALSDPRVEVVTNDGRNYVEGARRRWDVIVSEPPNVWVSGVSGLFTREFYAAAHAHLEPGGILCQWLPLHELERDDLRLSLATITSVFRYAAFWTNGVDTVVIAADELPRLDRARLAAPLRDPGVQRDLADLKIAPAALPGFLEKPEMGAAQVPAFIAGWSVENVDDLPRLEFDTARNLFYFNKR
ncbi:MAG TPA: spermidine synthase, partial [Thermoanaerobaculia bacterium]|nr:spermidine synthase [Thermoanaerobaculia bacterium]